jgi:putative endonuclease
MRENLYYVYFMQSTSRKALYIGICRDLDKRVWQHRNHVFEGFTDKYNCTRLVYYERFSSVHRAIAREKQLKRWSRAKKEALVISMNPHWLDLAAHVR